MRWIRRVEACVDHLLEVIWLANSTYRDHWLLLPNAVRLYRLFSFCAHKKWLTEQGDDFHGIVLWEIVREVSGISYPKFLLFVNGCALCVPSSLLCTLCACQTKEALLKNLLELWVGNRSLKVAKKIVKASTASSWSSIKDITRTVWSCSSCSRLPDYISLCRVQWHQCLCHDTARRWFGQDSMKPCSKVTLPRCTVCESRRVGVDGVGCRVKGLGEVIQCRDRPTSPDRLAWRSLHHPTQV